jgi:hypothetical protein
MIGNSIFVTSIIFLAAGFYLAEELRFLAPYRAYIFQRYGTVIAWFSALVFFNLFAAIYALNRQLFLKDTGRKLAHVEKQLRTGSTISAELSDRLSD